MDTSGTSALYTSVEHKASKVVRMLLDRPDTDVNQTLRRSTPLIRAIQTGNSEIIEMLLAREDLDVNATVTNTVERHLFSALSAAVANNNVGLVRRLLARGDTDPNVQSPAGLTPVICAVEASEWAVVACLLLDPRVEVNEAIFGIDGELVPSSLMRAVGTSPTSIVKWILSNVIAQVLGREL